MRLIRRAALAALIALAIVPAHATDWPTKPVTIYVTTAAGGNTDLMARMAAEHLSAKLGKPFVVENRPSAGGAQASGAVVNAAPDGYSLLFTPSSAILLAPLVQKMGFDPDKSLTPVTNVGTGSQVIAIKRSLPVNNLAEFLAYAKANPGKLNFAAAGTNNISHLAPLLLFKRAGAEVVMVPSRGEPQAIADLIAGNVDFYFGNTSVLLAQREHPAIRLLAVGTAERIPSAPDLPTASETAPGLRVRVVERLPGAERHARSHHRQAARCRHRDGAGRRRFRRASRRSAFCRAGRPRSRLPPRSRAIAGISPRPSRRRAFRRPDHEHDPDQLARSGFRK